MKNDRDSFFERFCRKLGLLSSDPAAVSGSDPLLKKNLSPLMGRRDAAYERLEVLMGGEVFAYGPQRRIALYAEAREMAELARKDTGDILLTLHSPDTESREHRMQLFLELLTELLQGVEFLSRIQCNFFQDQLGNNEKIQLEFDDPGALSRDETLAAECEISLVHRIRDLVDSFRPRVERYRAYAGKNFSAANAERYQKSRREYSELFSRRSVEKGLES